MELPGSRERVVARSSADANRRIHEATLKSIEYFRRNPHKIATRLQQLEKEWDVERVLEANASAIALTGLGLGLSWNRKFLLLPVIASGLLLQHALEGWCRPVEVLRRRGWRTREEINSEGRALEAIRANLH